ncbi:hypothetical protein WN51_06065 [Melipona quadrifasciata]|uniref:Uncharacterized protein n=1 Tax=Melipona quadrifasciata TaxID=166423 RepID=A0A0N0U398_9HYME|nr:hypothetical protein WN51_06065 [Melipona quadrifasciata]
MPAINFIPKVTQDKSILANIYLFDPPSLHRIVNETSRKNIYEIKLLNNYAFPSWHFCLRQFLSLSSVSESTEMEILKIVYGPFPRNVTIRLMAVPTDSKILTSFCHFETARSSAWLILFLAKDLMHTRVSKH